MQLFQVTDFKLEKPLTLIHTDHQTAADMFILSFVRSMGNFPDATYEVADVRLNTLAYDEKLFGLITGHRPGFIWPSTKQGWELFDPYEEW